MDMRALVWNEFSELPHVVLTFDVDWDPKVLDRKFGPDHEAWEDAQDESPFTDSNFDETGNYLHCHIAFLDAYSSHQGKFDFDNIVDNHIHYANQIKSSIRILIMKPSGFVLLGLLLISSSELLQLLPNMLTAHISYPSTSISALVFPL